MPETRASSPNAPSPVPLTGLVRRVLITLEMIKFSHTIFGLPFALLGALLAARGVPAPAQCIWIILACVFARSAAMSFNRLHDEPFDRMNPRTKMWALPAGLLSRRFVGAFCLVCALGFVFSAWMLNRTAFLLSPVALAVLLGYSTMKRLTAGTHFFLGAALGMAPVGAWVAIRGEVLAATPIVLGLGVMLWTAGFDIIYSMQDVETDRRLGLHSMPSRLGRARALAVSSLCHIGAVLLFSLVWAIAPLGTAFLAAVALCAGLLAYEQSLVFPDDISRLGRAFFTLNGWVSVLLFLGGATDILTGVPPA